MRSSHNLAAIETTFDEDNLVANLDFREVAGSVLG